MAAEKASDGGSGRSARGTGTTWKLPGRLCGRWADTAVCGRGAARGGLECTPARRPERRREGEGTKRTDGEQPGAPGPQTADCPGPGCTARAGGSAHCRGGCPRSHTRHTGTQHVRAEPVGHGGPGPRRAPARRRRGHLLWLRPWWNVPGAGPVTMASLETPTLAEESALKEITWRGSWEIIPKGLEFKAPGSLGLPAL